MNINYFIILTLTATLMACGGSDGSSKPSSGTEIEVTGVAQKGPLQPGSTVMVSNWNPTTLEPTTNVDIGEVHGYIGEFKYSYLPEYIESGYLHYEISGYFFNEITGESDEQIKLYAVAPSDIHYPTVSIATDMLTTMFEYQMGKDGLTYEEAVAEGTDKLLDIFGYGEMTHNEINFLGTDLHSEADSSAILLAMSASIMEVAEERGETLKDILDYTALVAYLGNGSDYDILKEELRMARFAVAYGPAYENTKAYFEAEGIDYEAPNLTYFLDVYGEMPDKKKPIFSYLGCIATEAPAGSSITLPVGQLAIDYQGRDITYEVTGTNDNSIVLNEFTSTEDYISGSITIPNVGESGEVNTFEVYFNTVLPEPANYEGKGCATIFVE